MDTPDRELDALGVKPLLPGQHVLIHAVDQRAVEIEQKSCGKDRSEINAVLFSWGYREKRPNSTIGDGTY